MFFPVGLGVAQYTSSNYKVQETFFGTGGNLENQSTNYKAKTSVGELGVGNISSPNFQAYAGFNTSDRIVLEVIVNGGTFDMGTLTTAQAKAQSTTFSVKDYLSSGYTVQVVGSPPKNSNYTLAGMTVAAASSPGTEQFGINLAANNLPSVGPFGAVPTQVPDNTFGFGYAVTPYDTSNLFKYISGDTIARSDKSSGATSYTISMIANINRTTIGGTFATSLYVRAVPTY